MDPDAPADDNKYTIGIATTVCLMPLPVVYWVTRPIVELLYTPWTPGLVAALFVLSPPLTAFVILYCGAWHLEWSRLKRVVLSALMSWIIVSADLALLGFLTLDGFVLGNCLLSGG
jgi:hypothetical protein